MWTERRAWPYRTGWPYQTEWPCQTEWPYRTTRLYRKTWPCQMAWPYGTMRVPSRRTLAFLPSYVWRMQEYETLPQTETSGASSKSDLGLRTYMRTFAVVNGKVLTGGPLAGTLAGGCGGAMSGER